MKKTILHLIVNLGRGGAETALVRVLKELPDYYNIVVTLENKNDFSDELKCDRLITLGNASLLSIPLSVVRLKKIIKQHKVDLIHSQLPRANFIARLSTPGSIPLVTTIHNSIANSKDYKRIHIRVLDKFTYKYKKSKIIACSQVVLQDYFSVLNLKRNSPSVLYNFVDVQHYNNFKTERQDRIYKIVCICSLSTQKNLFYIINALQKSKTKDIEVHIYGDGPLKTQLQKSIEKNSLPVILKGQVKNVNEVLPHYDLFVLPSLYEGFSLSVLEAMAVKLPLLLSDIPSFREQCEDLATYFDLNNSDDFLEKLNYVRTNKELMKSNTEKAYNRVIDRFTLEKYMTGLRKIYSEALKNEIMQ